MEDEDAFGDLMDAHVKDGFKAPKKHNNIRTRFWFTELGWNRFGREIAAGLGKRGIPFKVMKRKNPKANELVWGNAYQMAVLPQREER